MADKEYLDKNGLILYDTLIKGKIDKKVDKVDGKGLSTNDYDATEKEKVTLNTSARHSHSNKTILDNTTASFTTDDKSKLDGLNNYTLPDASKTTKGGVIIGDGLDIDENGKLYATGGGKAESVDWEDVNDRPTNLTDFENDLNYTSNYSDENPIVTLAELTQLGSDFDEELENYKTSSEVESYVTGLGYQTATQVETAITNKGYQTSSQVESIVTGKGYQTASEVESKITGKGYITSDTADQKIATAISSTYKASGSIAFANLPALAEGVLGNVYNITDSFTTTAQFAEGAGKTYPAGTNVAIVKIGSDYKYDVMAGFVDLSSYMKTTDMEAISTDDINNLFK